ncbi:hypothetical protein ASZ78_011123 [Callipepla squamata]|uniref:Cytoskeleton-associated protein 2 C-terminal domain-containing protein n=1 Tax=Callipepla squamata TaxID=9009 RepID=A0A226MFT8_CALSU|nr:hypothetical protein ASZ78_011123 [Callipepla squamata]
MAARLPTRLPASRRSQPEYREQRRQKVEEYLSRKKTFSGMPIHENETSISGRTRKAASNKLQDKAKLSASPKQEMEDKENANEISWDQSSRTSEENILKSSTLTLAAEMSYNPEDRTSVNKVTEMKSQNVLLSKSFSHIKNIKEKQMMAEKHSSNASLPKKPVLGTYRGRVIQSKINSFWKAAPRSEGEKSSLSDEKLLTSTTKPAMKPLSRGSCHVVLKTDKVTNYPNSVKPNCVPSLQSKPPVKPAVNSHSSLNKQPSTSAAVPKKLTVQKVIGKRGPQTLKAASKNSDYGTLGVKKCEDLREDGKLEAPAKQFSVPGAKTGQDYKANNIKKSLFLKESAEERRVRLAEWRASRGKVMKRPPTSMLLGTQPKNEEQEPSSTGCSLDQELNSEKVNKTLAECLQLAEQGSQGNKARAMLEELSESIPGAKKLVKYWICWMRLEQMGPPEKLVAGYEEAVLAGAMPRDELRRILIDTIKNTENLAESEDVSEGAVIETHLTEVVEMSKELSSSVQQVHEAFKDLNHDDQKAEDDDNKAETGNDVVKKEETDLGLKPEEAILPKKNKKRKNKDRTKKKGKSETKEQNKDRVKDAAQTVNSPEKDNGTDSLLSCNPSTNTYLESVKIHYEGNSTDAKDLMITTPLRYSLRIREKMFKYSDTPRDSHIFSSDQLQELESKPTALIHKQNDKLEEISSEVEE